MPAKKIRSRCFVRRRVGRGCGPGQYESLDRSHLVRLERVFERRHSKRLASASKYDSLELMMRFGRGVSEIRNAGACDSVHSVAINAELPIEETAFVHGGR